jgi:hypothetical protein
VPDAVAIHRDSVEIQIVQRFMKFHPDSHLVQELEGLDESTARTDAVAGVEEDDGDSPDGWQVRWVLAQQQDGALVVRSVHLRPKGRQTPPGGVTVRMLRNLSPSAAIARLSDVSDEFEHPREFSHLLIKWARHDIAELQLSLPKKQGPGRPRLPDDLLVAVALAYLEELPHGPGLLRRVAEHPEIDRPVETVRDWVRVARDRHFLTPTKVGQKGAAPGAALIEYLRERTKSDGRENA